MSKIAIRIGKANFKDTTLHPLHPKSPMSTSTP